MESIFIIDIIHKFELDIECFNPSIFSSNQSLDLSKLLLVQSFLGIVILFTGLRDVVMEQLVLVLFIHSDTCGGGVCGVVQCDFSQF